MHTGIEATQLTALVMLVLSVSPMLAPLVGSALIVSFGWRAVFVTVTIAAVLAFVLMVLFLPETRPPQDRVKISLRTMLDGFGQLLRDWRFLGLTFIGGLGTASFLAFIASSSFIYVDHYRLTPTAFSFAFSINAVGFIGASQFAAKLGVRFGMGRVVVAATSAYALFTKILLGLTLAGVDSIAVMIVLLFFGFSAMGLVIPSTMVLALEEHGPIAGTASALGGTLQMVTGGIMIVIVGAVFDGTARPMVTAVALCAIGALLLSVATMGRREFAPQLAE